MARFLSASLESLAIGSFDNAANHAIHSSYFHEKRAKVMNVQKFL